MSRQLKKNLIYTIAFDSPNSEGYRFLGKMLASSLVRTFFNGDIIGGFFFQVRMSGARRDVPC